VEDKKMGEETRLEDRPIKKLYCSTCNAFHPIYGGSYGVNGLPRCLICHSDTEWREKPQDYQYYKSISREEKSHA